jgi:hypothetical protein
MNLAKNQLDLAVELHKKTMGSLSVEDLLCAVTETHLGWKDDLIDWLGGAIVHRGDSFEEVCAKADKLDELIKKLPSPIPHIKTVEDQIRWEELVAEFNNKPRLT